MIETETARLRMFAGPNGSGKSTIKSVISSRLLGIYLNPDEIEKQVRDSGKFDLRGLEIRTNLNEIKDFYYRHPLTKRTELADFVKDIGLMEDEYIDFSNVGFDSYMSAILTDFLRYKCLQNHKSFTFETVMSSADKIDILRKAQSLGYRTYLYYVATEDPTINLRRIQHRVRMGGHPVPEQKVIERYHRSLDLLSEAIKNSHRAYIFDNSGEEKTWIAEITEGSKIEIKSDTIPIWFQKNVLQKI